MGLDLIPQGKAKPGHDAEWRSMMELYIGGTKLTDEQKKRFNEISIPGYANIGAPRVGYDRIADEWIVATRKAKTQAEVEDCLKTFHGYYVLKLVGPPACPKYSHACFGHVDEVSFRGEYLSDCEELLGEELMLRAWRHMWPEEAIAYGRELLRIAGEASKMIPPPKAPERETYGMDGQFLGLSAEDPIDILRSAGEWYVFWGERGHPIGAWS